MVGLTIANLLLKHAQWEGGAGINWTGDFILQTYVEFWIGHMHEFYCDTISTTISQHNRISSTQSWQHILITAHYSLLLTLISACIELQGYELL